jgi:hypothetical protein
MVQIGRVREFLSNDQVGWFDPYDVQVGESGDFYGLNQNRNRIVRIAAPEKVVATYSLKGTGEDYVGRMPRIRVVESLQRFYIATEASKIHALGFDGKLIWTIPIGVGGFGQPFSGEFDADDQGNLYVLLENSSTVQTFTPDGKPGTAIELQMGERKGRYYSVRFFRDEILVKRVSNAELFQVYDRKTGALKRVVHADVEEVKVELPGAVWTAGASLPVSVAVESRGQVSRPQWPLQLARFNDPQWQQLPVAQGKFTVPADAAGLYRVRVGGGDYTLDGVVEIRPTGSKGSVSVLTPLNRVYYGRGEVIPVRAIVRGPPPGKLQFSLRAAVPDAPVVWTADAGAEQKIPAALTAALRPGKYVLTVDAPGYTVAPQPLVIGPGLPGRPPYSIVQYIDGGGSHTTGSYKDIPESVAAHIKRSRKLNQNLFVDYAGWNRPWFVERTETEPLIERLKKDPLAVAPEKADIENAAKQTFAAYGAYGMEQLAVMVWVDSMIPFGDPAYHAKAMDEFKAGIRSTMQQVRDYPAFRGWSWFQHLWIHYERTLGNEAEREHFREIRKRVLETGKWDPEIERFTDKPIAAPIAAEKAFDAVLQEVAPGKISAVSGPYRQPWIIPPITFKDVDEIDLSSSSSRSGRRR